MYTNVDDKTTKNVMDPESHYCPLHLSSFIFIRTLEGHSKTTECLVTLLLTCSTFFHIQNSTFCPQGMRMNRDYFPKQHSPAGLCIGDTMFCVK